MNFKILCTCIVSLAISSPSIGMEIERSSLMAPEKLGRIRLFHKDNRFVVEHNGQEKRIQPCFVSKTLRSINRDQLKGFLHNGYIQLKELRDENGNLDYKLDALGRLQGGGFIFGAIATVGVAIAGAAATAGVGIATTITLGPVAGVAAALTTAAVAKTAVMYTAVVTLSAPTP